VRHKFVVLSLVTMLLLDGLVPAVAGRASAATPSPVVARTAPSQLHLFDKTWFLLHMGAAYYAFHHWVWLPY